MAEAAGDVPVVVGGLGRCDRYKSTYRTLGVAGQKDFRSGKDFMKDAASRTTMNGEQHDPWKYWRSWYNDKRPDNTLALWCFRFGRLKTSAYSFISFL